VGEGRRVRGNLFFSATIGHDPAQLIACITARAQIRRSVTTFPARSLTGSPIAAVILPAIRYINRAYGCSTLAGLFRAARVGLVTPLRDGMNLVAKEYVASQNPDDPGVLILSRFAGAAHECQAALLVNPYDPDSVAVAIERALSMPLVQRRERHNSLFEILSHNDVQYWAARFLGELEREPASSSKLGQVPSVRTQ
jgi:trehalose-6-phosphate synthase